MTTRDCAVGLIVACGMGITLLCLEYDVSSAAHTGRITGAGRAQDGHAHRKLLDALAFVESSNNPRAVSPAGARGLYQFMPATWGDVMNEPFTKAFDPVSSETAAIRYLEWIRATLTQWKGSADVIDVLACWHGGIGRYRRLDYNLARMPERTKEFVARVTTQMRIHDN